MDFKAWTSRFSDPLTLLANRNFEKIPEPVYYYSEFFKSPVVVLQVRCKIYYNPGFSVKPFSH